MRIVVILLTAWYGKQENESRDKKYRLAQASKKIGCLVPSQVQSRPTINYVDLESPDEECKLCECYMTVREQVARMLNC